MSPDRPTSTWHPLLLSCESLQAQKCLCCTFAIFFLPVEVLQEIFQFSPNVFFVYSSLRKFFFLLPLSQAKPLASRTLCVHVSLFHKHTSCIPNKPCHLLGALQTPFPISLFLNPSPFQVAIQMFQHHQRWPACHKTRILALKCTHNKNNVHIQFLWCFLLIGI